MVFPIHHWNGEQAEKAAGQKFKSEEEYGMCLFAKFTQSLCALLNVVSARVHNSLFLFQKLFYRHFFRKEKIILEEIIEYQILAK